MIGPSLTLIVIAVMSVCLCHGTANTIDWIAIRMHDFASDMRKMQQRRTAVVSERWHRTLEGELVIPALELSDEFCEFVKSLEDQR